MHPAGGVPRVVHHALPFIRQCEATPFAEEGLQCVWLYLGVFEGLDVDGVLEDEPRGLDLAHLALVLHRLRHVAIPTPVPDAGPLDRQQMTAMPK